MKFASIILIIMTAGCVTETDVNPVDDGQACHTPPCLVGPITCETDEDCGIGVCDQAREVCRPRDECPALDEGQYCREIVRLRERTKLGYLACEIDEDCPMNSACVCDACGSP